MLSTLFFLLTTLCDASISQLGSLYIISPQRYEVDPHEAYRHRGAFEAKHGVRGARLIESFGNGHFHPGHHHDIYRRNLQYAYPRPSPYFFGRR